MGGGGVIFYDLPLPLPYRAVIIPEAGSGRYRRPLHEDEAGGVDGSGRYINNDLRQGASALSNDK
jgi:hypothetical protein